MTSLLGVLPDQDEIKNEATLAANHNQTENEASLSAWSYSLEELRKLQDTAPIKFKLLDFTSCDDEWLLQLFPLRAGLKANCKLSPPPSWRVNAKLIRQWRRLGPKQQKPPPGVNSHHISLFSLFSDVNLLRSSKNSDI